MGKQDEGFATDPKHESFAPGAVFLGIPRNLAHAIRNDGEGELFFVGMAARPFE